MRCELVADIVVERFALLAEMAWMERRPELGLLCRAARDMGRRLSAEAVERALPGVRRAGVENLVAWCRMLGLCDERGALTQLGEQVADTDEAPVPEQGIYDLWVASHPLFGTRILHVERLQSAPDARFESVVALPVALEKNRLFQSVVEPGARYVLRALPSGQAGPAGCIRRASGTCRLRWRLDFSAGTNQWQLEGALTTEEQRRSIQHEPESEQLDLWPLFGQWAYQHLSALGQWSPESRRLAVPFSRVPEESRESFVLSQEIPALEVPGKGRYAGVKVQDIPIAPARREDATRWARARLERTLVTARAYRTRADVRRLFLSLVDATPLAPLQPTLPDHGTLSTEVRGTPEVFWSLVAPVDLAPLAVAPEEQSALTAGAAPSALSTVRGPQAVRLPQRARWSMQELVAALLEGCTPRRVLLCDRYVRGEANLRTLDVLIQALREFHPAVQVEVVTEPDAQSPQAMEHIRKLVGRPPRLFNDMFGTRRGERPHSRYLLVETEAGKGFGWQMDNSPLDARLDGGTPPTPRTPLHWRDFAALRVERESLMGGLGRWFGGGVS